MEIIKELFNIIFNEILEMLIKFSSETIRAWKLVMCHIKNSSFKLLYCELSSQPISSPSGAPSLKSLRLIECRDIVDLAFKLVITKFPMLEELEISNCMHRFPETLEVIGDVCPLLKRFRLSQRSFYSECVDDNAAMAIAKMSELRSLQLTANSLTNSGLELILNGCPLLESLDIRSCYHVCMDDEMQAKCARIKTLRHPEDSMDDYDLSFNYTIPRPCWSTEPIEYSMGCQSPY
uniref:Uncharacterized protein n=1 Tax=Aegilops tauschii TaxID=37682 RepID=M8B6V1_AEGTA